MRRVTIGLQQVQRPLQPVRGHNIGDALEERDVDDNLLGRDGKSHPTTRNLPAFMRLGFLKFTPDDEEGEGHNDYNASQELLAKTAFRKQEEWLENMY